ncbi:tagatose-bisphosphate aldolase [Gemmobacter aquarius]|uniref:Tagatose-bisphosphate aldolase n=1 Tax=Paragemmobacter aquarius TaxID=2169400 RepID=A0A2S0UH95_9RHOB|nr:class II D-tagatose-bisphosphate aldolase, non-catalytic subunit [Gemmobacter aquarius]AWB47186.1 tagatose-bisphosphate aldolase [Gemmobacter aquarius]
MTGIDRIIAENRGGRHVGLPSWCTAHPETLAAILRCYRDDSAPILIEATCNQVNQHGGYTGMTPATFRDFVHAIARAQGIDPARIILGGDHLGPNPWKHLPAPEAMANAREMVAAYSGAGFTKIHLDASMACGGETLTEETMAARAADLAAVAEPHRPHYVIGTEVPVPGGEVAPLDALGITTPEAVTRTLALHRMAFADRGLPFDRILAIVVQPGVDFGNDRIYPFAPAAAATLCAAAPALNGPLYEAHSTDYQSAQSLAALVRGHFPILKVGPELTFAFRQAVFAMEALGRMLGLPSNVETTLRQTMHNDPSDWRAYVAADDREAAMMLYGLSDRVRYYWPRPHVQSAVTALYDRLRAATPEPGLVAQVTGGMVRSSDPATLPETIIDTMVGAVVRRYRQACED